MDPFNESEQTRFNAEYPTWFQLKYATLIFLAEYEIVDKIGEGSFAEVLKCVDKNTGEKFAAKRLKKSFVKCAG